MTKDKTVDTAVGKVVVKAEHQDHEAMFYHPMTGQYICFQRNDSYLFPDGYEETLAVEEVVSIVQSWDSPYNEWLPWPPPACGSRLAGGSVSAIDLDRRTITIQYGDRRS